MKDNSTYIKQYLAGDMTPDEKTMFEARLESDDEFLAEYILETEIKEYIHARTMLEEIENDPFFSEKLARLADVYINDAFAVSHRSHASVVGVAERVQHKGAGFLLQTEMDYFHKSMDKPIRPLVALVGGAKVSSKLGALQNMLDKVDSMIIGGAMANTFLKSTGISVGASKVEDDLLNEARDFIDRAKGKDVKLYFPVDFIVADSFSASAITKNVT